MTGKVIMPTKNICSPGGTTCACLASRRWRNRLTARTHRPLGTSETHSDRMECTANGWGTFIGIIAITKIAVALTGGKTTRQALGALYIGHLDYQGVPAQNDLMEAYGTVWKSCK